MDTRVTIIVPTANSLGWFEFTREENGIDPNRDFSYDPNGGLDRGQCMQTMVARSLNEIWRRNAIQMAITFHAGMRAITYEWGSPNHPESKSPDHWAQVDVTNAMRDVGLRLVSMRND